MTAYFESVLDNALAAPGGSELVPIIGACLVAPLLLVLVVILGRLIAGDKGEYVNPRPSDWAPRRIGDE